MIEFTDAGQPRNVRQLRAANDCLRQAARANPNGVVTVIFVHGWRHDASWDFRKVVGDQHLLEFQRVLQGLSLREAERYTSKSQGRRVFGVFLGWPGAQFKVSRLPSVLTNMLDKIPNADLITFWNRYDAARRVGERPELQHTLTSLIDTTRTCGRECVVVLVGHSMGALILESAYTQMLPGLISTTSQHGVTPAKGCARIHGVALPEHLPDLVLLLNSASASSVTENLITMSSRSVQKEVHCPGVPAFHAPLFISATSTNDLATKYAFYLAKFGPTGGHDKRLVSHSLDAPMDGPSGANCPPIGRKRPVKDFGQSWHCLRTPQIDASGVIEHVAIDLPEPGRSKDDCHRRYVLRRLADRAREQTPFWVVRVPERIMSAHNDIFNEQSRSFVLALIQLGGGLMSVWEDYQETFEPEMGSCMLP